jgi:hypothetical protein
MKTIRVQREMFDRARRVWTPEMLPTDIIKAGRTVSGAHSATAMYRKTVGAGSWLEVTGIEFSRIGGSPLSAAGKLWMIDRDGTFSYPVLGSKGWVPQHGGMEAPLYVIRGSWRVMCGSVAGGSFYFGYQGLMNRCGTETVAA